MFVSPIRDIPPSRGLHQVGPNQPAHQPLVRGMSGGGRRECWCGISFLSSEIGAEGCDDVVNTNGRTDGASPTAQGSDSLGISDSVRT